MRRLFEGRTGMALAFVLGLVIATGATAGATSLITGGQIKNGTIGAKDLSKAVRKKLARARVPGPRGVPGPQGAKGGQGPAAGQVVAAVGANFVSTTAGANTTLAAASFTLSAPAHLLVVFGGSWVYGPAREGRGQAGADEPGPAGRCRRARRQSPVAVHHRGAGRLDGVHPPQHPRDVRGQSRPGGDLFADRHLQGAQHPRQHRRPMVRGEHDGDRGSARPIGGASLGAREPWFTGSAATSSLALLVKAANVGAARSPESHRSLPRSCGYRTGGRPSVSRRRTRPAPSPRRAARAHP